jgi:hypothetical protein
MESFWATLKTELVGKHSYASYDAVRHDILLSMEGFSNLRGRHSVLGHLSLTAFE